MRAFISDGYSHSWCQQWVLHTAMFRHVKHVCSIPAHYTSRPLHKVLWDCISSVSQHWENCTTCNNSHPHRQTHTFSCIHSAVRCLYSNLNCPAASHCSTSFIKHTQNSYYTSPFTRSHKEGGWKMKKRWLWFIDDADRFWAWAGGDGERESG